MAKKEQKAEKIEKIEEQEEVEEPKVEKKEKKETKVDKKETKKSKKSKSKDPAENLDDILYGSGSGKEGSIDMGEIPDFMALGKGKSKKDVDVPEFLKH